MYPANFSDKKLCSGTQKTKQCPKALPQKPLTQAKKVRKTTFASLWNKEMLAEHVLFPLDHYFKFSPPPQKC